MHQNFIHIITFLYGLGGIITFIGFIPTMRDLRNKKPSANIQTYIVWTSTMLITSIYGFLVLKDTVFNIVINLQLLACIIILILRLRIKANNTIKS